MPIIKVSYDHTLEQAIKKTSLTEVANSIGLSAGAVSIMAKKGRAVYLKTTDGVTEYAEVKGYRQGIHAQAQAAGGPIYQRHQKPAPKKVASKKKAAAKRKAK